MATTVKPKQGVVKRISSGWIDLGENVESSIEIIKEFSVAEIKALNYRLSNQVKMNTNGTPYLLCIDDQEGKKAAIYMFKHLSANVSENQLFKADEISIYHVKSEDEDGNPTEGFIIGTPEFTGGISMF